MTFRKVDIIFVALALLVVGGVALLPSPRDRNPKVPVNSVHQAVIVEKDCLTCHVPTGAAHCPRNIPSGKTVCTVTRGLRADEAGCRPPDG